jgi:DNA-binding transcriptional regulator YhcF (GntR family)
VWYALSASFHYEGRCPTYRELAGRVGCSIGSVQRHLMKLEIAGVVFWLPGAARSVVLRRAHPHWQRDHEAGLARMRKFGGREHVRAALKDDIW